jgi:AraC-like DNA-binding protein
METSLDLARVEETQRAATWSRTARDFFPGLSVRGLQVNPKLGTMHGQQCGPGWLWTILSPPLNVTYSPEAAAGERTFSVMLQLEGSTDARQSSRSCRLNRHEFCVIDQDTPFELEVAGLFSHLMFLQMPREAVVSRHPYLEQRTAERFEPDEPGAMLVRTVLLGLLETAPFLEQDQRAAALTVIAQALGVPKPPGAAFLDEVSWRARTALACIDSELADPSLTASRVAQVQGISRRRLDEILLKTAGTSLSAQIWNRRLQQAATDLIDPRYASRTVTQIAFAVGFEDAAHFTRAFKRRYHCTPREWRNRTTNN